MERRENDLNYNIVLDDNRNRGKLYISNIDFAENERILAQEKISCILTAAPINLQHQNDDISYLKIELFDNDYHLKQLSSILDRSFYYIEKNLSENKNVLVHCVAGISRSATIVIAYLMRKNSWTYLQAYEYLKDKRNCIHPNKYFVQELKKYENKLGINSSL